MADFSYGGQTILSHPIVVETILPFFLFFTIVFAVLQKSKILGDGKKQIDAIVGLVVGLLVIAFGKATGIILLLVPFLAVSLVIILVLLIMVGSVWKMEDTDKHYKALKQIILWLSFAAVAVAVVYITGFWQTLTDWFFTGGDSTLFINIIFGAIIIGAIILVLSTSKSEESSGKPGG